MKAVAKKIRIHACIMVFIIVLIELQYVTLPKPLHCCTCNMSFRVRKPENNNTNVTILKKKQQVNAARVVSKMFM